MRNHKVISALAALMVAAGVAASPIAAAAPSSNIDATGGAGTQVDKDGTQGELAPAVQGAADDDNDQDAYLKASSEAVPQFSAAPQK